MKLHGYAATISAATGVTDAATLEKIEDTMRHVVFHSTLDWQTAEILEQGAREAYGIVRIMARPQSDVILPEDTETARMLGVDARQVPGLRRSVFRMEGV